MYIKLFISFLVGLIFMYILTEIKAKCFAFPSSGRETMYKVIKTMYRQMARYMLAAKNDLDILIGYAHMSYAMGYLWSLEEIASADIISDAVGKNHLDVRREMINIQDEIIQKLMKACPTLIPDNKSVLIDIARGGL